MNDEAHTAEAPPRRRYYRQRSVLDSYLIQRIVLILFLFGITVMPATVILMYFEPAPQPTGQRELLTPQVKQGDFLRIRSAFRRSDDCAARFHRRVIDANDSLIFSQTEERPSFVPSTDAQYPSTRSIQIPEDAAVGPARYSAVVEWMCNPVQRIAPNAVQLPVIRFDILPREAIPPRL
jgi:hypothetical protein